MAKSKLTMRIPFFRSGRHTDNKGNTHEFTESELRAVASNYKPSVFKTPLVIGHPKNDDPAYGHVNSIEFDESTKELVAIAEATDVAFAEAVNAGKYGTDGKISPAWYARGNPHNPIQNGLYPRHIGFLGAVPPAVKGLSPLEFNDGNNYAVWYFSEEDTETEDQKMIKELSKKIADLESVITELKVIKEKKEGSEFNEGDPSSPAQSSSNDPDKERIKELTQKIANLEAIILELKATKDQETEIRVQAENAEFCEGLIKAGKLLPAQRKTVEKLLSTAPAASFEFNEAQTSFIELLKNLLDSAPSYDFSELATKNRRGKGASSFEYDEGTPTETIELDQRIRAYMAEHNITDYSEAYQAVRALMNSEAQ